jgi:hypothetical protein
MGGHFRSHTQKRSAAFLAIGDKSTRGMVIGDRHDVVQINNNH